MKYLSWVSAPVLIVVAGSLVAGCGAPGSRQQAGTGTGAIAGGVIGGLICQTCRLQPCWGAVIGAVAGGLVGGAIGKSLDDEERRQLALASELSGRAAGRAARSAEEGAVEANES